MQRGFGRIATYTWGRETMTPQVSISSVSLLPGILRFQLYRSSYILSHYNYLFILEEDSSITLNP